MRLTEKLDEQHTLITFRPPYKGYYRPANFHTSIDCYNKCGKLEDIEDELGIEILTLLNMQLHGDFYVKLESGEIEKAHKQKKQVIYFTTPDLGMMYKYEAYRLFYYHSRNYYFKDYGKTWSLRKEDFE